ncbi:MAG: fibronectin type III domain-containing protein [Oscillospiraceae bacterium]|nr:fibronectin type III domain-containing protein [Oscillospiraceae bacterium]
MKKTSKVFRSFLSVLLVLTMVIGLLPMAAFAQDAQATAGNLGGLDVQDVDGDGTITYVSFGDSVTNGYGMDDYRYDSGRNVLGFKREVATAYPAMVKACLEAEGMVVELEQMAISGFRMDELHWMLDEDGSYVPDPYHDTRYDGWNRDLLEDLLVEETWVQEKYGPVYGTSDAELLANADAIISSEYREAVRNADLITIDLGTNNFGTFLTSTILNMLGLSDNEVEVDFTIYLDEQSAASLEDMLSQMVAQMIGEPGTQAYDLGLQLARCLMFGYLGYTFHFDAALDEIYRLNPDAQVVIVDVYSMITGVELAGGALGDDVDLDQLYDLFIDMANFYSRELSPYASKVTHATLEGAPELFIDYYKDYPDAAYPDSQYLHPTAERLMDEFTMEMLGYDPDRPADREAFQAELMDGIETLDSYVNDIHNVVDQNVISGVVDPAIRENIDPVVEQVGDAIEGVLAAKDAVEQSVEGVAKAEAAVDEAVESVAFAQTIVDMVVENLIEGEYASYFEGSNTSSMFKSIIVGKIEEYITDDLMVQAGFEPTDENRTKLAEEVYVMACVYYDELNVNGGTQESANRLAVIEGIRYILVERGSSEADAQATAELAYELDRINTESGREAAVKAALESAVGAETAEQAYQINGIYQSQIQNGATQEEAMAFTVEAVLVDQVGQETADLALQLYGVYDQALTAGASEEEAMDAAIVAAIQTEYPQEGLAEAIYAVYKDKASATYEQKELAYITLMTGVELREGLVITQEIATALFHCYADDLDGQFADPYVKTTMCFFLVYQQVAASFEEAEEVYGQYLTYKRLPTTLSKIAKCPTIYFDALLAAAAESDDIMGDVAQKFMDGTLALDEPVREDYASEAEYEAAVATYQSDSALATLYFRFMTQDGVFTHPSEAGQEMLFNAVETALCDLKVAQADGQIQTAEKVLVLGDDIAAAEGSYVELLGERMGSEVSSLSYDGFRINEVRALLDDSYAGDEYTTQMLGTDRDALAASYRDAIAGSDVVVLDLGAMNMGFIAPQLDKYLASQGAQTYAMDFASIDSMKVNDLGATVDGLLAGFEDTFSDPSNLEVGALMLAFETYGYGFTTYMDCLGATVDAVKALQPDVQIVLVGRFDLLGDAYFQTGDIYLELGDFIGHATTLMDRYLRTYAEMEGQVHYVDVSDTENGITEPFNMADVGISESFDRAIPTADGYAYMAGQIGCALGGHSRTQGQVIQEAGCTVPGVMGYVCGECGHQFQEEIPALGHSYGEATVEKEASCGTAGVSVTKCATCGDEVREEIPALEHEYSDYVVEKDASCDAEGVRVSTCGICGDEIREQIPALGHSFGDFVVEKEATCSEEGVRVSTCDTCGDEVRESIPALEHSFGDFVVEKEASCIEEGVRVSTCTICGEQVQEAIPTVAHTYGDAVVKTEPTCTDPGTTVLSCSVCGHEVSGSTSALGHSFVDGYCQRCGESEQTASLATPVILSCYSKLQTSVKVTWSLVEGASGYELWRSTTPDDPDSWSLTKTIMDGEKDRYTNQGLTVGQTYYYKVRAFRLDADETKVYSQFSDVDHMPAAVVFDGPYSNATFRIRLRWDQVDGAHGYQIWRLGEDGTYYIVKTLGDRGNELTDDQGATTAYSNTGLVSGGKYTYKMRAFTITEDGRKIFGAYSDEITVAVMPETPVVSGSCPKAGRAKLTWDAVDGAAGYQIWMATSEDGDYQIVKSITSGETTSYTKYDLVSGETYYFKVRAYVEVDGKKTFGGYSEIIAVTID